MTDIVYVDDYEVCGGGDHWEEGESLTRLRVVYDQYAQWDDLVGDCFDPEVNTDIDPEELKAQEQAEMDRAQCDGVWGIVGEFWNGEEWEFADSVWGFIGDDFKNSGYDEDVWNTTIEALNRHLEKQARELENERLDMYAQV